MTAGVRRGDPSGLCDSLRQSPLLAVLRPGSPAQAQRQIDAVAQAGFHHVELAWTDESWWLQLLQTLPNRWPELRFGVAGVRCAEQLVVAHDQGLRFAMSPISCPVMLEQADALGLTLVPGVFSPSEVHRAGCRGAVKLFPAASLGPAYWRQLRGPMAPLPFCIAAGGLRPLDLSAWFASGVEAVALGSTLLDERDQLHAGHAEQLEPYLRGITTSKETL